jgi:hypothetical protein
VETPRRLERRKESVSGKVFDDRPVLLIHSPGQQSEHDVPGAVSRMTEHDFIAEMPCGKIDNPKSLNSFLISANPFGSLLGGHRGSLNIAVDLVSISVEISF